MTPHQAVQAFAGRTYADETAAMANLLRLFEAVAAASLPRFELRETDHGIDGFDAKTILVARFTDKTIAEAWLAARGFNHREIGWYWHIDPRRRNTMGAISYAISDTPPAPVNPT